MRVLVMTSAGLQPQSCVGRSGTLANAFILVAAERDEVYAGLMLSSAPSAEPPAASDTWEWTLWRSAEAQCERTLDEARWSLIVSALEFAGRCGVGAFRMLCEADFLPELVGLGWEPRPLELPRPSGAGSVIAVTWRVRPAHLDDARVRLEAARTVGRRSLARMDVLGCA